MKNFFKPFSYIFHPLFVPIFGALLYFAFEHLYFSKIQMGIIFIQFAIITILLPLTIFYFLLSLKKVDSIMIADVTQRKIPLFLNIILLLVFVNNAIKRDYFESLHFFLVGGILASFITLIGVYFKKKFSIHALGVSSLLFYGIGLQWQHMGRLPFIIPFLIFILGAVWTSRLYLNAHTNRELFFGTLIGGLSQVVFYYWYCF